MSTITADNRVATAAREKTDLIRRLFEWGGFGAGLVLIVLFGALLWRREPSAASAVWAAGAVVALGCVSWLTCAELRRRRVATELPAVFALATALYLGEHLVSAVVGTLAAAAVVVRVLGMHHARQDLRRLMADQARWAHRRELGNAVGGVRTVPSDVVAPGDLLVVPCGATVAVDCRLAEAGYFDESALGGRLIPVLRSAGEPVGSGAVNVGPATEMWATRLAEDSAAQRLARGAERASADRSVLVRLTDLLAPAFLVVVGLLAALGWVVSGQPSRVLAVLAAAALAPLVLAARIAVTAGMSRAARRGAVVPDGRDFDRLARVRPGDQACRRPRGRAGGLWRPGSAGSAGRRGAHGRSFGAGRGRPQVPADRGAERAGRPGGHRMADDRGGARPAEPGRRGRHAVPGGRRGRAERAAGAAATVEARPPAWSGRRCVRRRRADGVGQEQLTGRLPGNNREPAPGCSRGVRLGPSGPGGPAIDVLSVGRRPGEFA